MKFQKKVFLVYSLFGIIFALAAGGIYYSISKSHFVQQEYQSLENTAKQIKQQYTDMLESMEDVSHYLLSDSDTLSAIVMLTHLDDQQQDSAYIREGKNRIRLMMSTDYLNQNYYRVIYYNIQGDIIASNDWGDREIVDYMDIDTLEAYKTFEVTDQDVYIQGIHEDIWGKNKSVPVFSLVKEIQGRNMGFIEIQKTQEDLDDIFKVADPSVNVCLIHNEHTILYQTGNEKEVFGEQFADNESFLHGEYTSTSGQKILAVGIYDKDLDTRIIIYESSEQAIGKMTGIYLVTILVIGSILLFSFFYTVFTSKKLTKPIEQLRIFVRNVNLNDIDHRPDLPIPENEFNELKQIYQEMKDQINLLVERENRLSTLQLKAQLDVLQAQVNPHFIYNVLNIISSRGLQDNDDVICDICDDLAGMLRYTTNTKEKLADISQEKGYLEKYFSLLKYRYEYKLLYEVDIAKEILNQLLPKMILQQLVENSIVHGYEHFTGVMEISVKGWEKDGRWYIRIRDNGEGFDNMVLQTLNEKISKIRRALSVSRKHIELEIGGMGIVNTYARFYLLHGDDIVFRYGNWEHGAEILIGAPLSK